MTKVALKASIVTACFFAAAVVGYFMHGTGWTW